VPSVITVFPFQLLVLSQCMCCATEL